jgi:hypothetical protein
MQQQANNIVTALLKRTSLTERAILEAREQKNEGFAQFVTRTKWKVPIFLRKKQGFTTMRSMANVQARVYTVGFCHGKLNPLHATYQFSFITPQQLVQNWLVGDWEADLLMEKYMRKSNRKTELRLKMEDCVEQDVKNNDCDSKRNK